MDGNNRSVERLDRNRLAILFRGSAEASAATFCHLLRIDLARCGLAPPGKASIVLMRGRNDPRSIDTMKPTPQPWPTTRWFVC